MTHWKKSDIKKLVKKKKLPKQSDMFFKEGDKKPRKEKGKEEYYLQRACVKWFQFFYPELIEQKKAFHIPNQAYDPKGGFHYAAMGRISGPLDYLIMIRKQGFAGLWLDFKSKGSTLSEEQKVFAASAIEEGYACREIDSLDAFIEAIEWYLGVSQKKKNYFR